MKVKCIALVLTAAALSFLGNAKSYWGVYGLYGLTGWTGGGSSGSSSSIGSKTFSYGDVILEPQDSLFFSVEDLPDEIDGSPVLSEFLPDGIEVTWTGKRFKVPAAGFVKYSKKEGDFVATKDENPCGFKISISKKGKVSGSFKVYVQKSEKKVKAYSAKFSGYLDGDIALSIKKAGVYTVASLN